MAERPVAPIVLTPDQLERLPEYSASVPTGPKVGFRWKCKVKYTDESKGWLLCEATEHADPDLVGITTREVIVRAE